MNTKTKSNLDKLGERGLRNLSVEKFQLYRNMCFGAAAACLAIFLQMLDIKSPDIWQLRSLWACAFSMPLWFGAGGMYEFYIMLGPKSYAHYRSKFTTRVFAILIVVAGACLVASIICLLYAYLPLAAYLFVASICVSLAVSLVFIRHLANWFFARHPDDDSGPDA